MKALPILGVVVGSALAACTHRIELPMTAGQLAARPGASELVAYLGQPDADPRVCDGAGVSRLRDADDLGSTLTAALREGKVPARTWGACVEALLGELDAPRRADLADRMVGTAAGLVADARVEQDPDLRARLETLVRVYLDREPGPAASARASRELDDVRHRPLGPAAQQAAHALAIGLELERGRWEGRRVGPAELDLMASDFGVGLLLRAARRLPDPALRARAARLLVRQRIVASPFAEVRAAGPMLEEAVLERGTNPVSLAEHPVLRASLDPAALPSRLLVVRQQPLQGTVMLLARAAERPSPSLVPPLSLRGALSVELAGLSRPVTVCAAARAYDPTPCLPSAEVGASSPLARVRAGGDVRIDEQAGGGVAVALAREGVLRILVAVGGAPAGAIEWSVSFERPPDLVLSADRPGADGPDLVVTMARLDTGRIVYRVDGAGQTREVVVEAADAPVFRVVSRGAPGADGAPGLDGADGSSGMDGTPASCPAFDGGDGSRGGDGGPGLDGGEGLPGGRGGTVRVVVVAPEQQRDTLLALARTSIASEGGPEGAAGREGGEVGAEAGVRAARERHARTVTDTRRRVRRGGRESRVRAD